VSRAVKTEGYYTRVLDRAVLEFYRGNITAFEFIDTMLRLIDDQFRRAWNEGARDVGYELKDMTAEDLQVLQVRIDNEKEYILNFAGGIEQAAANGDSVAPYRDRVSMWANRYNEIRDWARAYFGGLTRLEWQLGMTEHCESCLTLSGTVATATQWNFARSEGIYPQSRRLKCGGYKCQCSLAVTDKPITPGGIPGI
jgi:hypothetical protein